LARSGYFEPVTEQDGYFLLSAKPSIARVKRNTGWAVVGLVDSPNSFLQSMNISYGGDLTLLGYSLIPDKSVLGQHLHLIIEWQAIREFASITRFWRNWSTSRGTFGRR